MLKQRLKKAASVLVVLCLIATMSMGNVFALSVSDYSDINGNSAKAALIKAVENGLLVGNNGKLRPNDPLLRAQMAAIINRAFGSTEITDISGFKDVSPKKWYAADMAKAVKMGTFVGSEKNLAPEKVISRQDAFVVLARAFKLSAKDLSVLGEFNDKAQISPYAKEPIAALASAGYLSNIKGKLNPRANMTRADFAVVMDKLVSSYIKTAGTYTTVVKGNVMVNKGNVELKGITITGDLIIGDGVGKGDVTLDGVKVTGRTIVRGGGANSIHVINGSAIAGKVIVDNVNNQVRIVTDKGTTIQNIDTGSRVVLEGNFGVVSVVGASGSIEVKGDVKTLSVQARAEVILTSGTVEKVTVAAEAADTKVNVAGAAVTSIEVASKAEIQVTKGTVAAVAIGVTAADTTVTVAKDAKVESVVAESKTVITGEGTVAVVEANANDVKVDTTGTEVKAAEGVTGVTAGDKTVEAGTTVTTTTPVVENSGGIPVRSAVPSFNLSSIQINNTAVPTTSGGIYVVSKGDITTGSSLRIKISGSNFSDSSTYTVSMTIPGELTSTSSPVTKSASGIPGSLLNMTHDNTLSDWDALFTWYSLFKGAHNGSYPDAASYQNNFDAYLSRLQVGHTYTMTFDVKNGSGTSVLASPVTISIMVVA